MNYPPDQPTPQHDTGGAADDKMNRLLADLFDRIDRGQPIDSDLFRQLSPIMRQEIRELLETSDFVEEAVRHNAVSSLQPPTSEKPSLESQRPVNNNPDARESFRAETILYSDSLNPSPRDEPVGESMFKSLEENDGTGSIPVDRIGDYELERLLGRGGMGVVYKARQVSLNRVVALKMILSGKMASSDELSRFIAEARAVARLRHPNIVAVYDFRASSGHHYFSMEYVEGCDLDHLAKRESLTEKQIARYVNLIAQAVEYAHQNGILHRDLKPANVLIDPEDQPHVTDFGLAKQIEGDSGLTSQGTVLGTPSYMSPEQAAGLNAQIGPTSDVYSLGAILYFLLTGEPPFRGKNAVETISLVISDHIKPVRLLRPRVSRALAIICEKCLRKNPAERYQTAQELAVELERFLRGDPIQARPINRLRRCWIWCRDIPLVAGLIGRKTSPTNHWQARLQLVLLVLVVIFGVSWSVLTIRASMLPDEIVISAGVEGGMYSRFSHDLATTLQTTTVSKVRIVATSGSIDNRDRIFSGTAHLGLLQESAIDIEQVAVVAPLYKEYVHVIVRKDSPHKTIEDLNGCTLLIGGEGSGNRVSTIKILKKFGITSASASFDANEFTHLQDNSACDAAIVISGLDNSLVHGLLSSKNYRLLPIPPREEIFLGTGFYPATIRPKDYESIFVLEAELATVATPALLVVHRQERESLVEATCDALFRQKLLQKLPGHFSPESLRYLTKALPMHPAAVKYFRAHPVDQFSN